MSQLLQVVEQLGPVVEYMGDDLRQPLGLSQGVIGVKGAGLSTEGRQPGNFF